MKLLLPLLALPLFVTACTSPDAPRRALWAPSESGTYRSAAGGREVWGPVQPVGRSDANATRRGLYSPSQASGPYTRALEDGSWRQNGKPVDEEMNDRREQQRINAMQTKAPVPAK